MPGSRTSRTCNLTDTDTMMKQKLHNTQSRSRHTVAARVRLRGLVLRRLSLYFFAIVAVTMLSFSEGAQAQKLFTLEEAASEVRERHEGARILKAEPKTRSDGSKVFRFRLLTSDGMVKTIRISADSDRSGNEQSRRKKKRQ